MVSAPVGDFAKYIPQGEKFYHALFLWFRFNFTSNPLLVESGLFKSFSYFVTFSSPRITK